MSDLTHTYLPLERVNIRNIRNIKTAEISGLAQVNIFFGENGSGKTSVLEALAFLPTARSFRNANIKRFISHEFDSCSVFGSNSSDEKPLKLGVSRHRDGSKQVKSNSETVSKLVDLAEELPFHLVYHKTFQILSEGPSVRRQMMDWGVFHVEHDFKTLWLRLQRAVKQRNKLLRLMSANNASINKVNKINELNPWTQELVVLASALDTKRQEYLAQLKPLFLKHVSSLLLGLTNETIELSYYAGWSKQHIYPELLKTSLDKDIQKGVTQYGPHRATLNITVNGLPAVDVLSRGQLKILLIAFKLAQGDLLFLKKNIRVVYFLDDLPSELDVNHLKLVCRALNETQSQLFITCIEKKAVTGFFNEEKSRLFHVEHGKIKPFIKDTNVH